MKGNDVLNNLNIDCMLLWDAVYFTVV